VIDENINKHLTLEKLKAKAVLF